MSGSPVSGRSSKTCRSFPREQRPHTSEREKRAPLAGKVSCLFRDLDLKVPELRGSGSARIILSQPRRATYDPAFALAVRELLSICPLAQEVVCGIELGWQAPFTEPEWTVA